MEKRREIPPQHGNDQLTRCEQPFHCRYLVVKYFCLLRAIIHTRAASYAAFMDDLGMACFSLDCFHRTAADAGVAFAAFILKRQY